MCLILSALVICVLWGAGRTAHAAVAATALEAIAVDINAPDGAGFRQFKQRLKPLLADPDPEVRGRAFVLYGRLVTRMGTPVEQEQAWIAGREHLAEGSDGWRCCTLGLARWQIAHARIEAGAALATVVREQVAPASARGLDALVVLGLAAAAQRDFPQTSHALRTAEWTLGQGPDYAFTGHESEWLGELRQAVDLLDPDAESRYWRNAEQARGDGRWSDGLTAYRIYLTRWPVGQWAPAAAWATGLCRARSGDVIGGKTYWQDFIAKDPQGSYRGLAWLGLTDLAIIDALDPAEAAACIAKGLAVCGQMTAEASSDARSAWNQLHLRAALLAYVAQDRPGVDRHLAAATLFPDPLPAPMPNGGLATPMAPAAAAMVEFLKGGGELVPASALERNQPKASLLLVVAAFLDRIDQEALGIATYQRLLHDGFPASQNQRACALLGMATACQDRFDVDRQVACYVRIVDEFPNAPVVPRTMYRMAIAMYARQLKNDEARAVLDTILRRFPHDEVAPDALFYRLMTCIWDRRWPEAAATLALLERQYPGHRYREIIDNTLAKRIQAGLGEQAPDHSVGGF